MEMELLMKTLGEPMRFKIFSQLLERKHCVRSLSKKLGITESAVSQHLKMLRAAGLVYGERCGYHIHYFPAQDALDFLAASFAAMREQSLELDRDPNVCNCEFRRKQAGAEPDGRPEAGPEPDAVTDDGREPAGVPDDGREPAGVPDDGREPAGEATHGAENAGRRGGKKHEHHC